MNENQWAKRRSSVVSMRRTSSYWLNRAERYRRLGQNRQAATLLRHAVALEPKDGGLREEYAETLQDMHCYEASTRAAFDTLTVDPTRFGCYSVIGHNMLALGHEQEALDAFSRFLHAAQGMEISPELNDELDDVEDMFDLTADAQPHGQARYEALLRVASRDLASGRATQARKALNRARALHHRDERIYTLMAIEASDSGDAKRALRFARLACRSNRGSVQSLCVLASVRSAIGDRARAFTALLYAMSRCIFPQETQMYCQTAMGLGFPELALGMLRHARKRCPDRLPASYDQAIVLLKLGRFDEADACALHCRALDPYDIPTISLSHMMGEWRDMGLHPAQVSIAARSLPYYPELAPAERQRRMAMIAEPLQIGLDAFCARLCDDRELYDTFLYALALPDSNMGRLLALVAGSLPGEFAERMLREILVRDMPGDEIKRYAAAALVSIGAPPPYVVWHGGRIAEIDPSGQPKQRGSMMQQMLAKRMRDLQRKARDPRLMTHALHLMIKMSLRQLYQIAADTTFVFRTALEQHYLLTYGLPDNARLRRLRSRTLDERRKVNVAFAQLCRLMPLPEGRKDTHEDH